MATKHPRERSWSSLPIGSQALGGMNNEPLRRPQLPFESSIK